MILFFVFLLILGIVFVSPTEVKVAQKIPRELWERDSILAGGGWALVVPSCPTGTSACDSACCPNSLVCDINLDSNWADQACCPDSTSCYAALQATPYCADDSWAMWWISGPANSGYFCCLEGQIGLTSKQCVSNEEVVASSLTASFAGVSITSGATFQTSTAAGAGSSSSNLVSAATSTAKSAATITTAPTSTEGSIGQTIKSAVLSVLHNDGRPVAIPPLALEGVIGAIFAILL